MPRLETTPDSRLLVRLLRDPDQLAQLSAEEMSHAIDVSEQARLLGWLMAQASRRGVPVNPPGWLHDRLVSATAQVREYDRSLNWEINRVDRALGDSGMRWVLLKGAAYLAADLPPGPGRRVADIDVLVPQAELPKAEHLLQEHGWQSADLDPYNVRFYRKWMHEIPPMVHPERGSIVDLHHAILPRTSRLQPSSARLLDRATEVRPGIRVLCRSHMVLHAAAHLFHDGEITGAVRDLVDLDGLLRHFGRDAQFWTDLQSEARALDLTRPAYYAIRYTSQLLDTPVPDEMAAALSTWSPPAPVRGLMDALVRRTLPGTAERGSRAAALALYARSHWLRMPPLLLTRHLMRKAFRRG